MKTEQETIITEEIREDADKMADIIGDAKEEKMLPMSQAITLIGKAMTDGIKIGESIGK